MTRGDGSIPLNAAPASYVTINDAPNPTPAYSPSIAPQSMPVKRGWSTGRKICCCITLLIIAGLITIGALIPFMIKQPSFRVVSTTIDCNPASKCIAAQQSGVYANITGQVVIEVNNPSILAPKASSTVNITRASDNAYIGYGLLPKQTIHMQKRQNVTVQLVLEPSDATNSLAAAAVAGTPAYRLRIYGPVHIQWGLIKFSRDVDERYTLNG